MPQLLAEVAGEEAQLWGAPRLACVVDVANISWRSSWASQVLVGDRQKEAQLFLLKQQ